MTLFNENTPLEIHTIAGRIIFVKRDDLFGIHPAPPLAKLRGMRLLLDRVYANGIRLVGCWDTRISKLGQGLAACCAEFSNMRCIVSYPTKKGEIQPEPITRAAELGAEVYPVPGGRITISFSHARNYVNHRGGLMLPFGLECKEAVEGVRKEASKIPSDYIKNGTVVVACGSGVTLAGLLLGFSVLPHRVIGVSSGRSLKNLRACINRYVKEVPNCLHLEEAQHPYSQALAFPCPFPSHPNYDLKAWKYLIENLQSLKDPILFWNIGA